MAIKINDYKLTKEKNIKQNKQNKKQFLFDFRIEGKRYRKIYKIKNDNQSLVDDLKEAKDKLLEIKYEIRQSSNKGSSVDTLSEKSVTTSAREYFKKVYKGIHTLYADAPMIKAFFFFAFAGRTKDEISTLKWEDINFQSHDYWIIDYNKNIRQDYPLPAMVKEALFEIEDDREGFVFLNPIKKTIIDMDASMERLKDYLEIDNLTLESMRTILVNALNEEANS